MFIALVRTAVTELHEINVIDGWFVRHLPSFASSCQMVSVVSSAIWRRGINPRDPGTVPSGVLAYKRAEPENKCASDD